MPAPGFEAHVK